MRVTDRQVRHSPSSLAAIGLMATLTAVGAHLRLPLPYVPLTLQVAFVCLAGLWLGPWRGAASQLVYVTAGLVGFPVFAKGGGPQYILEPSFGYLVGFIPAALVIGLLARGTVALPRAVLSAFAGIAIIYALGVAHLVAILTFVLQTPMSAVAVVQMGLAPLPKDLGLGLLAALLSHRLHAAGLRRR